MEKFILVINKLQDVFKTIPACADVIELPQIVVVGSQSSGKSSVLEGIVGRNFLPRGTGIVTRRPLVLQLINIPKSDQSHMDEEWAVFDHLKSQTFTDFDKVLKELERETERVAGTQSGISSEAIHLKIHSTKVPNLTLVDLPGITKVPVGDQPEDIEKLVHDMIYDYIKNPNCLILAVTPANSDLANSDAFKLAKEVDPERKRTIAVVTKLDIMDAGTNAMDILQNKVIPFKLGIVGIVNRSQQDIMDEKPIEQALKDEERFLRERYPSLADQNGSKFLSKTLNKLLMVHIKECLPELKAKVREKEVEYRILYESCGNEIEDKSLELCKIIDGFTNFFRRSMEGLAFNTGSTKLSGGGSLCCIFHDNFAQDLSSIDALNGLTDEKVIHAIRSATSPSPSLFISDLAFRRLVEDQVNLLRQPCLTCLDLVRDKMIENFEYCEPSVKKQLERFPKLRQEILYIAENLLHHHVKDTMEKVQYQVDIHTDHINTKHPNFENGPSVIEILSNKQSRLEKKDDKIVPENPSEAIAKQELEDKMDIEIQCKNIKKLVSAYFEVVRSALQDSVPKVIMHSLVRDVKENLGPKLNEQLYGKRDELFSESAEVEELRCRSNKMFEVLQQATRILNDIGAMNN